MPRAAIYTRISKDKTGESAGVERQLGSCREFADRHGYTAATVFSDNDISAYSGKTRPDFEKLLTAMAKGEFEVLVIWHMDRLHRSMRDLERIIDAAEAGNVKIESVNSGDLNLSTSAGRMNARILGSVARQESEHHGERRREANRKRALEGTWYSTGIRCYGYDRQGEPLEQEATLLRRAAKAILAGRSLSSIAREMNEGGHRTVNGTPWTNLKLRRALMTPRIAALSVHQDQIVAPGKWDPILDEATWRGLCAYLTDPSRRVSVSFDRKHLGSGLYICGFRRPEAPDDICGRKLSSSWPHGKGRSMVYVCRPDVHLARNAGELDRFVEEVVFDHLVDIGIGTDLRQAEDQIDVGELRTQRDALQARKDQLATLLRKGILDMAAVEHEAAILTAEIEALNAQMATAVQTSPATLLLEDGEDPEVLADDELLAKRWIAASPDIRGKIITQVVDVVVNPAPRGTRFDGDLIDFRWKFQPIEVST
ncbi:recombinase family protein [Mycobacterium sp. 2YAF39]|uniref:recombinase family protein n=1 Tax=Mycobacterium sp. 2YAF39 TaxID=3233033 RepID=UPI003F95CF7C